MLTLIWPWLLTLLPLPWLYRMLAKPGATAVPTLRSRWYASLAGQLAVPATAVSNRWRHALLALVWVSLLLAAARPTWTGEPITLPATGRDLLLAVDISKSMEIGDMAVGNQLYPRITIAKQVVGDFVEKRRGDRLGLILFGSQAYLQAPLTFDRRTVNTLLQEAQLGFAGGATAIGDAIAIAIKRLDGQPSSSKVLILLSDGADTASEVPPLEAAKLAAHHHVKIHTVGMGAGEMTARGIHGQRTVNTAFDLDEESLTAIAEITGGRYFRARDPQQLVEIYNTLDALEPIDQEAETLRPTKALYHWPLATAFILWLILLFSHGWRRAND